MGAPARTLALLLAVLFFGGGQNVTGAIEKRSSHSVTPPDANSILQRRLAHFQRGINLSDWLAQLSDPSGYTKEHFDTAITAHDLDLIQTMGFDHVRLSVDPRRMFHARRADQITQEDLQYLDAAVKMILDRGLAVEINIFADRDFKTKLASDDEFVEQFADFWRALARHYASFDADRVFFEILNEPEGRDAYRWYGVEAKLAAAIRDGAPEHTIIATGARFSDDDDLVFLEPLRDPNVIYAFHFYESHIFTHQGATWSANYWHELKGVPYPSSPENVQAAAARVSDAVHRLAVLRYGQDRWNAGRIDTEIGQVKAWAERYGVPVICDEFGVYRKNADPKDRIAWLTDVRNALEKRGIGWAMWEYHNGFGVVTLEGGHSVPDEATLRALGLSHTEPLGFRK
jgi:endoglucanase